MKFEMRPLPRTKHRTASEPKRIVQPAQETTGCRAALPFGLTYAAPFDDASHQENLPVFAEWDFL